MANFGQLVLTNLGIQEQYKAQGGTPLKFKRIGMGSGRYSGNLTALTRLVTENVSVAISNGFMKDNTYIIEGFFSNDALQTGFEWREIGVFVEDQNGNEILYCYSNAGDSYDYIPATGDERYSKYIRVAIAVGNASNISIVESEGILYVDTVTFNALADEVDSIHPSKVKSGSVIACEGGANLPLVGMKIHGKSEQIVTKGAQLLDLWSYCDGKSYHSIDENMVITINNTSTDSIVGVNKLLTGSIPAGTYTVANYLGNALYIQSNSSDYTNGVAVGASKTFTYDGSSYLRLLYSDVAAGKKVRFMAMLSTYDTTGDYEPYTGGAPAPSTDYPQDIVNAGDNGIVNVFLRGKNLLKNKLGSATNNGITYTENADGSISIKGTATADSFYTFDFGNKIHLYGVKLIASNDSVDVPFTVGYFDESNISVNSIAYVSNGEFEFEYPREAKTTRSFLMVLKGKTLDTTVHPMIRLASTDSSYDEKKEEQSLAVSTPNGLAGIHVSSGGNYVDSNGKHWLCDEVDLARGVLIRRTGTADLGALAWNYIADYKVFTASVPEIKPDTLVMVCTHYTTSTLNSATSPDMTIYGRKDAYGVGGIGVKNSNYTDAASFKSAMNGAIVLYELAEPVEVALTETDIAAYRALHSNNPTTTIFNDTGAEMSAEYYTESHEGAMGELYNRIKPIENDYWRDWQLINDIGNLYTYGYEGQVTFVILLDAKHNTDNLIQCACVTINICGIHSCCRSSCSIVDYNGKTGFVYVEVNPQGGMAGVVRFVSLDGTVSTDITDGVTVYSNSLLSKAKLASGTVSVSNE